MKIAYFITGLGLGGAEIITIDLAQKAVRAGHEVIVVYLTDIDTLAPKILSEIPVFPLHLRKKPLQFIRAVEKAKSIIKRFRPDIVHSNMVHSNIFTRMLRCRIKFPVLICSEHSKNIGSSGRMLAYRLTDHLSDLNTNVSQEAVDMFIKRKAFRKQDNLAVYNGIDLSRFVPDRSLGEDLRKELGVGPDDFVFFNAGRLTAAKDQDNLLRAFSRLPHGQLWIAGEGELRDELSSTVAALGIRERVKLLGARSDMARCYNAADCFVLSSAWDGFGIVLAEAMACGLPVITTDAGGCAEVVQNDFFVVPIRNSDLLSDKMSYICNLPKSERQRISDKNRILAHKFDLERVWEQWEHIYRSSLGS